jgi:DNA-binding protein HU-beta
MSAFGTFSPYNFERRKSPYSKKQASAALDALTSTISQTLASGDDVALVGFGTFKVSDRAARTGRNPQTGATIQISAARVPGWKAGKAIKDACNS